MMVTWEEPGLYGECVTHMIPVEEAIERQKKVAEVEGFIYTTDQQALDDFLTVHWGWLV